MSDYEFIYVKRMLTVYLTSLRKLSYGIWLNDGLDSCAGG